MKETWSLRIDLDLRNSLGRRSYPDAIVVQEDRNLVMAPSTILTLDAEDDLDAAYSAARAQRPLALGEFLVVRGRSEDEPWTYQAVVHDLELDPSCRPGDIRRALSRVVLDAQTRGFGHLAVEPLGRWMSRGLTLGEMIEALDVTVLELCSSLESSIRLTLMLEKVDELEEASHLLRSRVLRRASRSFRTVDGDAAVVEVVDGDDKYHFKYVPGTLGGYLVNRAPQGA